MTTKMKKDVSARRFAVNDPTPIEASHPTFENAGDSSLQATQAAESASIGAADSSDNQRAKASTSLAVYEAKERMIAARKSGPSHPLAALVKAEADLETRSAALQALSAPKQKRPDKDLLIHQLTHAVNTSGASLTIAPKLRRDTISLFSALDSSDPIESILDRHIVAVSIGAMQCHARAASSSNPKALDVHLRHSEKMTKVLIELVEARERRGRPKQVVVGNVNVEAGGQAIVGTVETHQQKPPRPQPDEDD